ncbi:glutamate--cysteine ligase [Halocella sp. SP3-1]|uniref:glutamate--cysteine ligase n=1 Tax=Halocella sp. SP3-1 TaxID=2382161 RepID=UPI000F760B32|nr:glutamate--cysteine ligase [Halocella sp. SP3-1]AZO94523.1 glutamate--cysteine ligase [Halocella sp. SP3-1]
MNWNFSLMLDKFSEDNKSKLLLEGKWGLEKESQRVTELGDLALTDHPSVFGDKLENPYITTDFSECQLELITPPAKSIEEAYQHLKNIQLEVEKEIKGELLWPLSMPPRLPDEDQIPIARFNNSREGRKKEIYRNGLALRYGKKRQMISGLHYNFSLSDGMLEFLHKSFGKEEERRSFKNQIYFTIIRNCLRYRWLLIYLFGASPVAHPTYYSVIYQELQLIKDCCPECCNVINEYEQFSTSLRVSRFGYSNPYPSKYNIYFNSIEEYLLKLRKLLSLKSEKYRKLGIYKDEKQLQLNDNLLQTESEFYCSIRPKQINKKDETMLNSLKERGVEYLEVRILDLNPFDKVGISIEQLYFLQVFMLFCLLEENKIITKSELHKINNNHNLSALCGRNPDLELYKYNDKKIPLQEWGKEIFKKLRLIALCMDENSSESKYQLAVENELEKITNSSLLPSSLILKEMKENRESYLEFGIRRAVSNKQAK